MKILFINEYGFEVGGVETYLKYVKISLEKKGHTVKILTSDIGKGRKFSDYTFKKINNSSIFRIFPYIWNFDAKNKLDEIIKEFKPDIIHFHFINYNTSFSVLSATANLPTLYTLHGNELMSPMGLKKTKKCTHDDVGYCINCYGYSRYIPELVKRKLLRYYSKNIDLFVAPSKHHLKLLNKYKFTPAIQLYNGIQLKNYSPINKTNNILFVGRLVKDKGVIIAIQSMKYIINKINNAKLIIVGNADPEQEKILIDYVYKNGLQNHIVFTGKVNNEDTYNYYRRSSVVIVPSIYPDNLPTVCIEASSIGRPVIGSNIGGIPELIDNNYTGLLVTPNDPIDLSNKIIKLLTNKELLIKYGKNARKKAENEFNIELHINKLEKIYYNLIDDKMNRTNK